MQQDNGNSNSNNIGLLLYLYNFVVSRFYATAKASSQFKYFPLSPKLKCNEPKNLLTQTMAIAMLARDKARWDMFYEIQAVIMILNFATDPSFSEARLEEIEFEQAGREMIARKIRFVFEGAEEWWSLGSLAKLRELCARWPLEVLPPKTFTSPFDALAYKLSFKNSK